MSDRSVVESIAWPETVQSILDAGKLPPEGIPTHLGSLNAMCRDLAGGVGLGYGWHCVIAGDTGHGKSLLATQLAFEALTTGHAVGFLSMEMSRRQLATRLYAQATGQPVYRLEPGDGFDARRAAEVVQYFRELQAARPNANFYVRDAPTAELREIEPVLETWREWGIGLLVVDYLQLCAVGDESGLAQELTRISTFFRAWAHRTGITVVALSQYNRTTAIDRSRSPDHHGLYGSARIGQDADICLCLDHSRYRREEGHGKAQTYLVVSKNRHGPTGSIPIEWEFRSLRCREALPDEAETWPQHEGRR